MCVALVVRRSSLTPFNDAASIASDSQRAAVTAALTTPAYFMTSRACVFVVAVVESGIAQALPEHPKRENIFAVSTTFGDAYLFQVRWSA